MKRCFSRALILALIALITLSPVMAPASGVVGESVESAVMQATDAGDTGLSVEGMPIAPEQTPEEAAEECSSVAKGDVPRELEFEIASEELAAPQDATASRQMIDPAVGPVIAAPVTV